VLYGLLGGLGGWFTGYLGGHLSFARSVGVGERGATNLPRRDIDPSVDGQHTTDELFDMAAASSVIGMPLEQIGTLVDDRLLNPVPTTDGPRFRTSDAQAVRQLGA
jgi:hypothetical protein